MAARPISVSPELIEVAESVKDDARRLYFGIRAGVAAKCEPWPCYVSSF